MATGEIEVLAESVEVFSVCRKLPFEIKDFVKVGASCYTYVHCKVSADGRIDRACLWLPRNQSLWGCSIATWTWGPPRCSRTSGSDLRWWWRWENTSVMCMVWHLIILKDSLDVGWLVKSMSSTRSVRQRTSVEYKQAKTKSRERVELIQVFSAGTGTN